jgi:tripartite-type tricarboxylate transporter receptor subunit TctC
MHFRLEEAAMARALNALLGALLALPVAAQVFPSKPIRVVVPFPPGGIDTPMRLIGPRMQEQLGQPIVIDNRAGANGIIGSEVAARSSPDGYTLLWVTSSTLVTAVFLQRSLPFDPVRDFTPLTIVYGGVETLSVPASSPYRTLRDLIDDAKRNPGKVTYSSSGIGSAYHLDGEFLAQALGAQMLHVPTKGTGPMLQEVLAGRADWSVVGWNNAKPMVEAGKLRVLALIDAKRYPKLPDVATVAETVSGFVKAPSWIGMVAPAALPRPLQLRLHDAIVKASRAPEPTKYFEDGGANVILNTPEEFAAQLRQDLDLTGKAIARSGIKPE